MSELVVVGFKNTEEADRALTELVRLTKEHLIDLEDAVVAIRSPDGTVRIKQSINLVGLGAAQGGLSGALWGCCSSTRCWAWRPGPPSARGAGRSPAA